MYAERYGRTGIKPGALATAIGLNGAVVAALMFASPGIITRTPDKPFDIKNIPLQPDPPPLPETEPETRITPQTRAVDPPPLKQPVAFDSVTPSSDGYVVPAGPTGLDNGVTGGTGTIVEPLPPVHVPVLTGVQLDPRYAGLFQPAYPPSEMRAGREGRVQVRVLVGIDGRVKQVELLSAASDAFFEATKRQALSKWRFKPALRDGVPEEGWRTMNVSFVINDNG